MQTEKGNAGDKVDASIIRKNRIYRFFVGICWGAIKEVVSKCWSTIKTEARHFGMVEELQLSGWYRVQCHDKDGNLKWEDVFPNLVTTVGKNYALDTFLAGAGFTVTGPFIGLISSTSYSAVAAADTMASHAGWLEAGLANAPTYSGNRKTAAWSAAAAGAKTLSANASFSITGGGTAKGCFMVLGAGALNTKDDTNGVLYSAGLFTGGDKVLVNTDILSVSYTATL